MKMMPVRKYLACILAIMLLLGLMPAASFAGDGSVGVNLSSHRTHHVYKPGDTVAIKGTAKGLSKVCLTIEDEQGKQLFSDHPVVKNETFTSSFTLDSKAAEGKYTIIAGSMDQPEMKRYKFSVSKDGASDANAARSASSKNVVLTIKGNGVVRELALSRAQLAAMKQQRVVFSAFNDWPSSLFVAVEGVSLLDLLAQAGIKAEAQTITFLGADGYRADFTVDELLHETRYCFPNLKDSSTAGQKVIEPLIALQRVEDDDDFSKMSAQDTPVLCFGQRALSEQILCEYVKRLKTITVSTDAPGQWDKPTAKIIDPDTGKKVATQGGKIKKGTKVILEGDPKVKIYYTTDGTIPNLNSKMYNISFHVPTMNQPLLVEKDTTIKAKTVGPGKRDSEVLSLVFTVDGAAGASKLKIAPSLIADTTQNVINKPVELTFTDDMAWRKAISEVNVNGVTLDKGKYSIKPGQISIDKRVFQISRDYDIVIKATGYANAVVSQKIGLLYIDGDGVAKEMVFTRAELQAMQEKRIIFSATNDFPADLSVTTAGVPLQVLLNKAGMKSGAQIITFMGRDGYRADFTVNELLKQKRYIFPEKTEVEPLIALQRAERSTDFKEMSDKDTPVLCLGQRASTEQTLLSFVKILQSISVSTNTPVQWQQPQAKLIDPVSGKKVAVSGGEVKKGSQIVLVGNPKTKIYYTTDGSEPNLTSPIFNLHGCGPLAGQEEPIVITENTTVKAKAVWPGKRDSEVASFVFTVPNTGALFK